MPVRMTLPAESSMRTSADSAPGGTRMSRAKRPLRSAVTGPKLRPATVALTRARGSVRARSSVRTETGHHP